MKNLKAYKHDLIDRLKVPAYACEYLNQALADKDHRVFLLALRDVAEAHGISRLAAGTKVSREHFYRMLSKNGNPEWETLRKVLDQIGLDLKVGSKSRPRLAA